MTHETVFQNTEERASEVMSETEFGDCHETQLELVRRKVTF